MNDTKENKASPNTITKKKKSRSNVIKGSITDALAGASAGAIAKTAIAPIERVKLIMQLRGSIEKRPLTTTTTNCAVIKMKVPTTAWSVAKSIYYEEGMLAFWRGKRYISFFYQLND